MQSERGCLQFVEQGLLRGSEGTLLLEAEEVLESFLLIFG